MRGGEATSSARSVLTGLIYLVLTACATIFICQVLVRTLVYCLLLLQAEDVSLCSHVEVAYGDIIDAVGRFWWAASSLGVIRKLPVEGVLRCLLY